MKYSSERILTTHAGSLPRNAALTDLLLRAQDGEAVDAEALRDEVERAVAEVVRKQVASGVDIINDGEQSKPGFQTYVAERMSGFGGESKRPRSTDYIKFPSYAKLWEKRFPRRGKSHNAPQAKGPVRYERLDVAQEDCKRLTHAVAEVPHAQAFMTAPSPGIIATTLLNAYYDSHERYVFALAHEMQKEYRLIHEQGFLLQIDAPDLAMERTGLFQDRSDGEFIRIAEMHVAALNAALEGIPRDNVRLHCCWGCREGPHVDDVALRLVLPVLYQAQVGALNLEFANPSHQHEYPTLKAQPMPSHMLLIPGVIDQTTNYVEHPEVVANRICEAVAAVGDRERVIAGVDCGFNTFVGYDQVAEDVVWEKLRSGRHGADIASERLWGKLSTSGASGMKENMA